MKSGLSRRSVAVRRRMVEVTAIPIDPCGILEAVGTPESGAIDMFVGAVRNHSEGKGVDALEYTAYVPMAEKLMKEIEEELRSRWPVHKVILIHRVGSLKVGEVA